MNALIFVVGFSFSFGLGYWLWQLFYDWMWPDTIPTDGNGQPLRPGNPGGAGW